MKKLYTLIVLALCLNAAMAQDGPPKNLDSLEQTFKYQYGTIKVGNGVGTITVPKGFKYLDSTQAERVLTNLWGNPKTPNMSLGFIVPEKQGVMSAHGYVFNIQYDEIGYVKDDDASEVNYEELLSNMQAETVAENTSREEAGFAPIAIVGWAAKPYYDADRHILHWAKEIKFGKDSVNTLNYNVRVLGRKGVLVLNAIATMQDIAAVKADVPSVLNIVNFTSGNKYSDFDSGIDKVAAWTIGGLVAGKILAKVGFFALALKFWKLIAIGFVAIGGVIRRMFKGRQTAAPQEKEPIAAFEPAALEADEEKKNDGKELTE